MDEHTLTGASDISAGPRNVSEMIFVTGKPDVRPAALRTLVSYPPLSAAGPPSS